MRRKMITMLIFSCLVVFVLPASVFCMGSSSSCDNPEGRTYTDGQEYSVDPCGQSRGAKLEFKCIASDIYHVELGVGKTPFCRVEYQAQGSGSGEWEKPVGNSKTLYEPVYFKVTAGTIKITRVDKFH